MKFRKLLYPFSLVYGGITTLRNKLFDAGILTAHHYGLPIISVGNITVGGTGKTPLTEYIIRLLEADYRVCLLSRGYKRQTKGALLADSDSTAEIIGDEPFQVLQKFSAMDVVVAEKRVEGMEIIQSQTNAQLVLMDDAYQHRYVKPGLSILVIDFNRPLWNDCPFPAGDLRETKRGQERADVIVVNKCPVDFSEVDKAFWLKKLNAKEGQQIFFTSIIYGAARPFLKEFQAAPLNANEVVALAGIAQPSGFFGHLEMHYSVVTKLIYPDHHHFSTGDLDHIESHLDSRRALVTTEKDAVRLQVLPEGVKKRCWFIPIELKVLFNEEKQFENRIRNYVRNHSNNG